MAPVAVILVGGEGRRLGGIDKPLVDLHGRPLLRLVLDRMAPQVASLALSVHGDAGAYRPFGLPLLPDGEDRRSGPLAGIAAALRHGVAARADSIVTVSGDTPFLPDDLVARLIQAGAPATVRSAGRIHPVIGLWPVRLAPLVAARLARRALRLIDFAEEAGATIVDFDGDPDPFFDIDTPEDLVAARRFVTASRDRSANA